RLCRHGGRPLREDRGRARRAGAEGGGHGRLGPALRRGLRADRRGGRVSHVGRSAPDLGEEPMRLAESLPPTLRKHVDPATPVPLRQMAARLLVPASPSDALTLLDRKSTRLNSSHVKISYAVFCLKKKKKKK